MIGIMDWGIGGLSVYKALRDAGSNADILYHSDAGSTPYGKLSRALLRDRFHAIAAWFQRRRVDRVLVCCHSASSALSPSEETGVEIIGGIAFYSIIPAARRAVAESEAEQVGVIGGSLTIQSGVYERTLAGLGKRLQFQSAQPLSAFVEAGELDSPAVEAEIARLLDRFDSPRALLLACTHYPALNPVFKRIAPDLRLLDPGKRMAEAIREEGSNGFEFFTTGDRNASNRAARQAFGIALDQ